MDYYSKDKEPWDWHREDYCLQKVSNFELWNEVPQNEDDLTYVFNDETTPVKACGDFAYNANNNSKSNNVQQEPEECWETSSQVKRRRMLQFNNQDGDLFLSKEQISSTYLKLNGRNTSCLEGRENSNEDIFPEVSQWLSGSSESVSASNYEGLESTEGWLADCLKDAEMQFDDLNFSGADDVHIDVAELCNFTPEYEQNVVQHHQLTPTPRNIVFKGRKSFIQTTTKLAASVAYPFAFIKPCDAHGDVTLKEINQRILSPPPSKSKQSREEEDPLAYPKSAFSGKPVVGKTKIRTEGGKGSITIMRTRG